MNIPIIIAITTIAICSTTTNSSIITTTIATIISTISIGIITITTIIIFTITTMIVITITTTITIVDVIIIIIIVASLPSACVRLKFSMHSVCAKSRLQYFSSPDSWWWPRTLQAVSTTVSTNTVSIVFVIVAVSAGGDLVLGGACTGARFSAAVTAVAALRVVIQLSWNETASRGIGIYSIAGGRGWGWG